MSGAIPLIHPTPSSRGQGQLYLHHVLLLGRPRRRWEDTIKLDFKEVGRGCGDWMELAQDKDRWWALVTAVMNLRVPLNAGNFLTS